MEVADALERARQLEGLGFPDITLQRTLGRRFDTAWKLVVPSQGGRARTSWPHREPRSTR